VQKKYSSLATFIEFLSLLFIVRKLTRALAEKRTGSNMLTLMFAKKFLFSYA